MKTQCPHCRQHYEIDDQYNGQIIECQKCGQNFIPESLQKVELSTSVHNLNLSKPCMKTIKKEEKSLQSFKVPVIVYFLRITGILALVVCGLQLLCILACIITATFESMVNFYPTFIGSILISLFIFGLAKIILLLAKVEYNTRGIKCRTEEIKNH